MPSIVIWLLKEGSTASTVDVSSAIDQGLCELRFCGRCSTPSGTWTSTGPTSAPSDGTSCR